MDNITIIERLDRLEKAIIQNKRSGWIDLKSACCYIGLSASTLRRYVQSGKLKCCKPSGKLMFRIEWLDKCMTQ